MMGPAFWMELCIRIVRHVTLVNFPHRAQLRVRGWRAVGLQAALTAVCTGISIAIMLLLPNTFCAQLLVSCLGVAWVYCISRCMLRTAPLPLLFLSLLQASYGDCINLVVRLTLLLGDGVALELRHTFFELALTVLTLPLVYPLMRGYASPQVSTREHLPFWRVAWLLPASNYIAFRLAVYPGYFSDDSRVESPWMLALLLWPVVTMLIHVVKLKLLRSAVQNLALQDQLENNRLLLSMQEQRYRELMQQEAQGRTARHDLRHHLLAIQGLLYADQPQEAERYLAYLREENRLQCTDCAVNTLSSR